MKRPEDSAGEYRTIIAAYKNAHKSEWMILDALLLGVETHDSGRAVSGEIGRLHRALTEAGIDVAEKTVQRQFWTAQWAAESQHAETIRSKGWTWSQRAKEAGWTQTDLASHIEAGGTTTGIKRSTIEAAKTIDQRCEEWISDANRLFTQGSRLVEDIENTDHIHQSAYVGIVVLMHARFSESFIDAEIRHLLEQESV